MQLLGILFQSLHYCAQLAPMHDTGTVAGSIVAQDASLADAHDIGRADANGAQAQARDDAQLREAYLVRSLVLLTDSHCGGLFRLDVCDALDELLAALLELLALACLLLEGLGKRGGPPAPPWATAAAVGTGWGRRGPQKLSSMNN